MLATDYFLDYQFHSFGPEFWSMIGYKQELGSDPWAKVFPKVTITRFLLFEPLVVVEIWVTFPITNTVKEVLTLPIFPFGG